MNIVVVLVTIVSTGFLLRFLVALAKEQKKTPKILRAHWLDYSVVGKNDPVQSERVSLRIVSPQEFRVLSRVSNRTLRSVCLITTDVLALTSLADARP